MSIIANWIRNRRWRLLAGFLHTEFRNLPKLARAKVLSSAILLRDSHLSNEFLAQVAMNPQNYSHEVGIDLANFFEDMAIRAMQSAESQGLKFDHYSTENAQSEKVYLFVRGCQVWTATFSCVPLPKNSQNAKDIWKLLRNEKSQVLEALMYMEGNLDFQHGLNGIHSGQFTAFNMSCFFSDAERVPNFRI